MISRRESLLLLALGLALTIAYVLFPGPLYYYDAHVMVPELYAGTFGPSTLSRNFLILPLGHLLCALGFAPEDALGLLSALAGAVAPLALYVGLRRLAYAVPCAAFAAALLALAPHVLFFALHIEKHGPHLAACAVAFAIAARPPSDDGRARAMLAPLLAFALVIGTHASGFLRWPFLAAIGWQRSRGPRRSAWALSGVASLALCAGCALFLLGFRSGWWAIDERSAFHGLLVNAISHWNFDPRGILGYAGHTFVPGSAVLLPLGLLGALLALGARRAVALPLLAWFFCDLYAYTAYGWVKMGGHVLATYVALGVGAAECARRLLARYRVLRGALLALAVGAQAWFGAKLALVDAHEPHPLVWSRDLREATSDRGRLITDWQAHRTLCELHSQLEPLNLIDVGYLPREQWPSALATLGDWLAAEERAGMPIFLDGYLDELARERPALAEILAVLRARFSWVDVSRGSFRGYRLEPPR
ncbi:MAG: hypothetical protein JNM84_16635 [Planctomycetes bacterium]|nr:hypothetical protein [Planctomycetota bacterium]